MVCLTPSGINYKDMTKEELQAKVDEQLSIINDANDKICSCVNDYIESIPSECLQDYETMIRYL